MANFLYSASLFSFTVTASPAVHVNFPASRLANPEFPLRESRSTSLTEQNWTLNFGSSLVSGLYGVAFLHTNFLTVTLATGDAADPAHASYTDDTGHTLARDLFTGRRKGLFFKTLAKQYLRVKAIVQTPTDDASYYACGAIVVATPFVTLTRNPRAGLPVKPQQHRFGGRVPRTALWTEMQWEWEFLSPSELDEIRTLALLGAETPFLAFLNRGHVGEVYWLVQPDTPEYSVQEASQTSATVHLREHIGPVDF
jgi:hypothetical protein